MLDARPYIHTTHRCTFPGRLSGDLSSPRDQSHGNTVSAFYTLPLGTSEPEEKSVARPFIQIFLTKDRTQVITVPIATSLVDFCNSENLAVPLHTRRILLKINQDILSSISDKILQDHDEITILSIGGKRGSDGSEDKQNPLQREGISNYFHRDLFFTR